MVSDTSTWPALSYESHPWVHLNPDMLSRRQRERFSGDYRAAVVPEISELKPHISTELTSLLDEASQALARFDAEYGRATAPFASILLRSESSSSSQIENLTSGAKAIALAELGESNSANALQNLGNVRAMQAALALSDSINEDSILEMQKALLGATSPGLTGQWRQQQVWIGVGEAGPHEATFVPPHHTRVPAAMADLTGFIARTDIAPLMQCAIAHAQFETIHPFPDGNGRTGRALMQAMMRHSGLTQHVTVPVSAGLLSDPGQYFDSLTTYREGRLAPILEAVADAALKAVNNGKQLVRHLENLEVDWRTRLSARKGASVWKLLSLALVQPAFNITGAQAATGATLANTYLALEKLEAAGIVKPHNSFRRNRLWICGEVIDALDAFADRARRTLPL